MKLLSEVRRKQTPNERGNAWLNRIRWGPLTACLPDSTLGGQNKPKSLFLFTTPTTIHPYRVSSERGQWQIGRRCHAQKAKSLFRWPGDKEQRLNLRDWCREFVKFWAENVHKTHLVYSLTQCLLGKISPVRAAGRKSGCDEFDKTALKALTGGD